MRPKKTRDNLPKLPDWEIFSRSNSEVSDTLDRNSSNIQDKKAIASLARLERNRQQAKGGLPPASPTASGPGRHFLFRLAPHTALFSLMALTLVILFKDGDKSATPRQAKMSPPPERAYAPKRRPASVRRPPPPKKAAPRRFSRKPSQPQVRRPLRRNNTIALPRKKPHQDLGQQDFWDDDEFQDDDMEPEELDPVEVGLDIEDLPPRRRAARERAQTALGRLQELRNIARRGPAAQENDEEEYGEEENEDSWDDY